LMWCSDTSGAEDGWDIGASNHFNIYNLGGHSTLETTGNASRITGGDVFDLYAYSENDTVSSVEATALFRNLQHIKLLPEVTSKLALGTFKIQYYIDYCIDEDEWLEGWGLDILIYGWGTGSYRHTKWTVWGYNRGEYVSVEQISTFRSRNGTTGSDTKVRFWIDLWINRINASTTVGGRINAYEYPMKDDSNYWLRWLTGNNWGVNEDEEKEFMFFSDILDSDGNVVSASQIQLMRIRSNLSIPAIDDAQYVTVKNYDVFDLTFGSDPLQGVQTPSFDETRVPVMPQGGFLGWLGSTLSGIWRWLGAAFGPALLNFWNAFVGFLDTIFTWAGWPNGFSQLLSWIGSLLSWLGNSFTYLLAFLTSVFTFLMSFLGKMLNTLSTIVGQWVSIVSSFFGFLGDSANTGVHLWNDLGLANWVIIGAILYPIFLFTIFERKGIDGVLNHLKMVLDIFGWIVNIFITVIQLFLNLIGRIIESIPVVE